MKLLHTGDLHLGKYLFEYSLLDDQIHMLDRLFDELAAACNDGDPYNALIIAGDIYDRSIPPPEAVTVFDGFLTRISKAFPDLHLLITAGNHDSAKRLSFGSSLFDRFNIHVRTDASRIAEPVIITDKAGFSTAFYLIPFLTAGAFEPAAGAFNPAAGTNSPITDITNSPITDITNSPITDITNSPTADITNSPTADITNSPTAADDEPLFDQAVRRVCTSLKKLRDSQAPNSDIPAVITAHIFTLGALSSDSERVFLGTAEQTDASLFTPFAYTALGHIHKPQKISDTVYYAGSPLAYSFSEAGFQKSFCRITLTADNSPQKAAAKIEHIPIQPVRRMSRLEDYFSAFYQTNTYDEYIHDYLEITLKDTQPVENAGGILQQKFPFIMNVRQSFETSSADASNTARRALFEKRQTVHPCDIFEAFLSDMHDNIDSLDFTEEKKLFAELAAAAENDEN